MANDPKAPRERCGADVEVMFYPDVPCNRFKGHEGDHAAAPAPEEDNSDEVKTTIPVLGASGVVPLTDEGYADGANHPSTGGDD